MPHLVYDDEGNAYSLDEVLAATHQMTQDEQGKGSMGGLASDQAGIFSGRTTPQGSSTPTTPTQETRPAQVPQDNTQTTAGTTGATPKEGAEPSKPAEGSAFGDFFRKRIFGGLDAGYVTGKRPMTLWDYATDVLSSYGGQNLGQRNAALIREDTEKKRLAMEQQKSQVEMQKSTLESQKMFADQVQGIYENYDQEQWVPRIKSLAKAAGIEAPAEMVGMTTTLLQRLHDSGADARDVMENPDKYDPALVNRLRHTATLWSKHSDESLKAKAEADKARQDVEAGKIRTGAVTEAQGLPGVTPAQHAAIGMGGAPQSKAMEDILQGNHPKYKTEFDLRNAAASGDPEAQAILKQFSETKVNEQTQAALGKARAASLEEIQKNGKALTDYFADPKFEQAISLLPSVGKGKDIVTGAIGYGAAKGGKLRAGLGQYTGDPRVQYLQSAIDTILPFIRVGGAGTKGNRMSQVELGTTMFGRRALALSNGEMTREQARAFAADMVDLASKAMRSKNPDEADTVSKDFWRREWTQRVQSEPDPVKKRALAEQAAADMRNR
jgi:hypothetical protein